jgi:hypothetical protein
MRKILSVLALMFGFSLVGSAGTLSSFGGVFSEDWETGLLTTNNWSSSGGASNDWIIIATGMEDVFDGTYSVQAENTDAETTLETNISTVGYSNISFDFYYDTDSLDAGEYLRVDWSDGTGWANVLDITDANTDDYILSANNLTVDADNNSLFAIRFRCSSSTNNEECKVDNISVSGVIIDNTNPGVFDAKPVENATYGVFNVIEISVNATDNVAVDTVMANITYPNSTTKLLTLTNAVGDKYNNSFTIPDSGLEGRFNVTFVVNDTTGNVNDSLTTYFISENPCTYFSGDWVVNCSDNCIISSDVDVLENNISITGTGTLMISGANVSNFSEIYIAGTDSANRCEVYCLGGGCFV